MRQIFFIFLLTFSNNSIAEWVEYSTRANGDVYFFDNTRVQMSANQVKVWNRIRYKTSIMGASSYQSLLKIECSNQAETTLQSTFYSDKDWSKPAMATNMQEKPKKHINKNSATKRLAELLCSK